MTALFTKDNELMAFFREKESVITQMGIDMRVNGIKVKDTVLENIIV
jgi:hypothetical protein